MTLRLGYNLAIPVSLAWRKLTDAHEERGVLSCANRDTDGRWRTQIVAC
jgi:hypothetical protein